MEPGGAPSDAVVPSAVVPSVRPACRLTRRRGEAFQIQVVLGGGAAVLCMVVGGRLGLLHWMPEVCIEHSWT